ncbi:hypothetical protein [Deinococcus sp. QL22]|uniref:hypothetical protein n=1 Tax=Deinococcus sp. QL22 TaxID=2939437 RepID=UPI00201788E3|nr:hypothetical protein [Deinococcus sp. QL22]UQN05436.1 hypothetical protein M1R55_11180 [Deinococcus sp. QL22]
MDQQWNAVTLQDWDDVETFAVKQPVTSEVALTRERMEHGLWSIPEETVPLPKYLSSPVVWAGFWGLMAGVGLLVTALPLWGVLH